MSQFKTIWGVSKRTIKRKLKAQGRVRRIRYYEGTFIKSNVPNNLISPDAYVENMFDDDNSLCSQEFESSSFQEFNDMCDLQSIC